MIKNSLIVHTSRDSISYKTTFILGVDQLTRLTIRTDYLYIQIEEMLMEAEKRESGTGLPALPQLFKEKMLMDIDRNAPVITRDEILIAAPLETIWNVQTNIPSWPTWQPEVDAASIDGPLAVGTVFHWQTSGLDITSTIQEIDPQRRIVWSGPAQGIEAVHVWMLTPEENGVRVHTEESWDGEPVRSQLAPMQRALDQSLRAWLENLKRTAEASTQS